jgi:hypothetical protein
MTFEARLDAQVEATPQASKALAWFATCEASVDKIGRLCRHQFERWEIERITSYGPHGSKSLPTTAF